ncbi:MAG: alcohol dehydrogenase, partial [Bacteroidia bacterium]
MRKVILFALSCILTSLMFGQTYEWRGPNRQGIFNETSLLKEWPEDGP